MTDEELKEKILKEAIVLFNEKGLKFTMDDMAKKLHISKKTIYKIIPDKKKLFEQMVDYIFDSIKCEEKSMLEDEKTTTLEKLTRTLGAMPQQYYHVNFQNLYDLKDKYPKIYALVQNRIENGWEQTIDLLEKGMEEGVIRKVSIPLFKTMYQATLEQFFQRDILVENHISYQEALQEVVSLMVEGIIARD